MKSKWSNKVNLEHPLPEYPRMNLIRDNYTNLNGSWEYQIVKEDENPLENYKNIIVPFGMGCSLSGALEILKPNEILWYRKYFNYTVSNKKTILHFEAVDQQCWVYLNGVFVGEHQGGYNPFSFDVTGIINEKNELLIKVKDYSEQGIFSYGKQRLNPKEIWYTPIAGIWQTVWLEDVSEDYVKDIFYAVDFDNKKVLITLVGDFKQAIIVISENGKIIKRDITVDKSIEFVFDEIHPWSIDDPFLYNVYVETEYDVVKSYFGMRKISTEIDSEGKTRFCLNNQPMFLTGILDQGYSYDSNYTYPCEEAMVFDISMAKSLGFNMLRKHVKQENRRFYYLCDKMGILVFQDMISGGGLCELISERQIKGLLGFNKSDSKYKFFKRENEEGRKMYYKELNDMIITLYNHPSIVCWTLFNEGWGQFDSHEVLNFVSKIDDSRLINHTSGFYDQGIGDVYSRHIYFKKIKYKSDSLNRLNMIGEYGGFSLAVDNHFDYKKKYGYKSFKNRKDLENGLIKLLRNDIYPLIKEGLSAVVLTQLYDVESECNGLLTYDRQVLKIDGKKLAAVNYRLIKGVK